MKELQHGALPIHRRSWKVNVLLEDQHDSHHLSALDLLNERLQTSHDAKSDIQIDSDGDVALVKIALAIEGADHLANVRGHHVRQGDRSYAVGGVLRPLQLAPVNAERETRPLVVVGGGRRWPPSSLSSRYTNSASGSSSRASMAANFFDSTSCSALGRLSSLPPIPIL